jgi:hypothetical protein
VFAALGFSLWSLGVERQGCWCCCVQLQLLQDFVLVGRGVQGGREHRICESEGRGPFSFFLFLMFHSCIAAAGQGAWVEYLGLEYMGR